MFIYFALLFAKTCSCDLFSVAMVLCAWRKRDGLSDKKIRWEIWREGWCQCGGLGEMEVSMWEARLV